MSQQENSKKSESVKLLRENLGLTQKMMGEKLNVSGNYIYQIEAGGKKGGRRFWADFEKLSKGEIVGGEQVREEKHLYRTGLDAGMLTESMVKEMFGHAIEELKNAVPERRIKILQHLMMLNEEMERRKI